MEEKYNIWERYRVTVRVGGIIGPRCGLTRYENLVQYDSSNNVELLNLLFLKDRKLPILTLIEHIGNKLQELFYNRHADLQIVQSR